MKIRGIISVISIILLTCAGTAAADSQAGSGMQFLLEPAGAEGEFILSCEGTGGGPAGVFALFPGSVSVVSSTLPENQYRINGDSLSCALIDEDTCSLQIRCASLQPGSIQLSWEQYAENLSGNATIFVSDSGGVSVSTSGSSGETESAAVQETPFACIGFTIVASFAAAGVYAGRRRGDSQ